MLAFDCENGSRIDSYRTKDENLVKAAENIVCEYPGAYR